MLPRRRRGFRGQHLILPGANIRRVNASCRWSPMRLRGRPTRFDFVVVVFVSTACGSSLIAAVPSSLVRIGKPIPTTETTSRLQKLLVGDRFNFDTNDFRSVR